jgi:exodeoxyribonuclease-3
MRIVEWNCQGAFRKKIKDIVGLKPDILVVPECENEQKLKLSSLDVPVSDFFWYGDSPNKGVGVFSFGDYKIELVNWFNPRFRYILPLKISNGSHSFLLFAIWAMDNKEDTKARYIGQVWLAINYYSQFISDSVIMIGDYNSNQIWDSNDIYGNHSAVVSFLESKQILSLYHTQHDLLPGHEQHPTFHMYRKREKPYHIDYCFASCNILDKGFTFTIDDHASWLGISDHLPLVIDFNEIPDTTISTEILPFFSSKIESLCAKTKVKFREEIGKLLSDVQHVQELGVSSIGVITQLEKILKLDSIIRDL